MRISLDCKTKLYALAFGMALSAVALAGAASAQTEDIIPTEAVFDPANFVDPATNVDGYHPTRPGMQWIRAGTTEVGSRKVPHMAISTITDVYRMIEGVPCVAMLDQSTDNGEIAQVGFDYLAVDKEHAQTAKPIQMAS